MVENGVSVGDISDKIMAHRGEASRRHVGKRQCGETRGKMRASERSDVDIWLRRGIARAGEGDGVVSEDRPYASNMSPLACGEDHQTREVSQRAPSQNVERSAYEINVDASLMLFNKNNDEE